MLVIFGNRLLSLHISSIVDRREIVDPAAAPHWVFPDYRRAGRKPGLRPEFANEYEGISGISPATHFHFSDGNKRETDRPVTPVKTANCNCVRA
jgi:hypothetical protein